MSEKLKATGATLTIDMLRSAADLLHKQDFTRPSQDECPHIIDWGPFGVGGVRIACLKTFERKPGDKK